jgi:hypothetical protein
MNESVIGSFVYQSKKVPCSLLSTRDIYVRYEKENEKESGATNTNNFCQSLSPDAT